MPFSQSSLLNPMDDDCCLLSALEGDIPPLRNFKHNGVDRHHLTGLLWAATPSETNTELRPPEELMSIPLEYISITERRRALHPPSHHPLTYHEFNDGEELPHGMRVAPLVSRSEENMKPCSSGDSSPVYLDFRALNASFSVLALPPSRTSSPLTLKSSSVSQDPWASRAQSPPLSPLSFGSPRLNVIDIRRTASPPSIPTSPRWNRQNLPQFS